MVSFKLFRGSNMHPIKHARRSKRRSYFVSKLVHVVLISILIRFFFFFRAAVISQIDNGLKVHQGLQNSVPPPKTRSQSSHHKKDERLADDNDKKHPDRAEADKSYSYTYSKPKSEPKSESESESTSEPKSGSESESKSGSNEEEDMYFRDPNATVADWDYYPKLKREPRRDASWTRSETSATFNKEECTSILNSIDTSPPPRREPSNRACEGYDGILHIHRYDGGAASGTAFFLFTIGMLAWAEQHNYLPWIHIIDGFTKPIWDKVVHGNTTTSQFTIMRGMEIGWARDPNDPQWHIFPGKPVLKTDPLFPEKLVLHSTGVWEHYFLPPNDFVPGDLSCKEKPFVRLDINHRVPGIHSNAPWAPRAWRYVEAPYILRRNDSWDEWFKPQRKHAAEWTKRYIRFNPMMERRAACAFPDPEFSLGMHIRHGDKDVERYYIEADKFLAFAEAFVNNGGRSIYLATDSAKVVETVLNEWPKHVADRVVYQSSVQGRSSNNTAAFDLGISAHRTNIEALTDILALSKSTFFLHGLSAMSEAAMYLNPGLVERSINLDDDLYKNYRPEYFVKTVMPLGKNL